MEKRDVQIAAQLYTVRAFTQTEEAIAETLRKVKEIGYDCVQVSAFGPYRTEFLREELAKNGLSVCATHTPYRRLLDETDDVIREHKAIGCRQVGLGYISLKTADDVKNFLQEIVPIAEKLHGNGLHFVYHNHQHEFLRLDEGMRIMDYILSHTNPEVFGLLPDLYWLQHAGLDPVKFLRDNAARIDVVHLKDMCVAPDLGHRYAEVFAGNMNYAAVLPVLRETGVRYAAVEQDECYGEDPFDCLRRSRENIRKHWGI